MNIIDPKDHVTRIIEELKEEAAQRRQRLNQLNQSLRNGHSDRDVGADQIVAADFAIPDLRLESAPPDPNQSQYSLDDLLAYDDVEFVNNAYLAVLKRRPEPSGLENAIEELRSGRVTKLAILVDLGSSPEARAKGVTVPGLRRQIFLVNVSRLPLLRYVTGPLYDFFCLRSITSEHQRSVARMMARQNALASYINDEITAHVRSIGPVIQEAIRLFDDLKRTQELIPKTVAKVSRHWAERLNEETLQRQQEFKDRTAEIEELRLVYNKYRTQVELTEKDLKRELEHLFRKYQEVKTELVYQSQRLSSLRDQNNAPSAHSTAVERAADSTRRRDDLDAFFASFDEHFRGNREDVKQRLRSYVPFIREHGMGTPDAPILDIACGRGEWLEVLKEESLVASGIDVNSVLVGQCREAGLEVTQADLSDYLRSVPESSLGAISAFHIVEHLPIERLISFLDLALITLRPGGLLLLETPNPQNVLVGSCNFYFDPTHRKPLPSPVLTFLVESRGFVIVQTLGLNPSDEKRIAGTSELARRFNEYFYGPMDYAIVASKV